MLFIGIESEGREVKGLQVLLKYENILRQFKARL